MKKHGMPIPTAELVGDSGFSLFVFWGQGEKVREGIRKEATSKKLFQLLNLGFVFSEPLVWSRKAKYSAEELKEQPFSDVLLLSDLPL